MAVSYNGLWRLLYDKSMKKVDMMNQVGISNSTVAKQISKRLHGRKESIKSGFTGKTEIKKMR